MKARLSRGATLVARRIAALRAQTARALAPPSIAARGLRATADDSAATSTDLPDYVTFTLARWRQLNDVPFRYLVPDARLLPEESIRFFTLDSDWLDALSSGALVAGGGGTREISQAQVALPGSLLAATQHASAVRDVLPEAVEDDRARAVGEGPMCGSGRRAFFPRLPLSLLELSPVFCCAPRS